MYPVHKNNQITILRPSKEAKEEILFPTENDSK